LQKQPISIVPGPTNEEQQDDRILSQLQPVSSSTKIDCNQETFEGLSIKDFMCPFDQSKWMQSQVQQNTINVVFVRRRMRIFPFNENLGSFASFNLQVFFWLAACTSSRKNGIIGISFIG